jgi:Fe-S-cluster containining protein
LQKLFYYSILDYMAGEKGPTLQEVSCDNCTAACCRAGSLVVLDEIEHQKHRKAMALRTLIRFRRYAQAAFIEAEGINPDGTKYPMPMVIKVPANRGAYLMEQDCGRLEDNKCGIYEERPQACRDYKVGSPECIEARAAAGLKQEEA